MVNRANRRTGCAAIPRPGSSISLCLFRGKRSRALRVMVARVVPTERIVQAIAGLVCLLLVGSMRDVPDRSPIGTPRAPPLPASLLERHAKVVVSVSDAEEHPVRGVAVRALFIEDDRAYLAGAAETDGSGQCTI